MKSPDLEQIVKTSEFQRWPFYIQSAVGLYKMANVDNELTSFDGWCDNLNGWLDRQDVSETMDIFGLSGYRSIQGETYDNFVDRLRDDMGQTETVESLENLCSPKDFKEKYELCKKGMKIIWSKYHEPKPWDGKDVYGISADINNRGSMRVANLIDFVYNKSLKEI